MITIKIKRVNEMGRQMYQLVLPRTTYTVATKRDAEAARQRLLDNSPRDLVEAYIIANHM